MKENPGPNAEAETPFFFKFRIVLLIAWILSFGWLLKIGLLLGHDFKEDPGRLSMFETEQERQQYLNVPAPHPGIDKSWAESASLTFQCKPLIYANTFYFDRVRPFLFWIFALIAATLIYKTDWDYIERLRKKLLED